MSTQKSRSQNSRSKKKYSITKPITKPSDYLKKYVGNTPENVKRMRTIFNEDREIHRHFPYLTNGDDKDFHIFYEYVENKHLLDEKKIYPFENTRDYSFLYWFLDEIVPQNWDRLGPMGEREKIKFNKGYYLNMSEIIEQSDINKYQSLISTTMFRGMRNIMPKPPLGEKDKNDSSKWKKWKIEYAKWKKQEYRLHPDLSRSRNDRSAPKELEDDSDEDEDEEKEKEGCISKDKIPSISTDVNKYYEQKKLFEEEENMGCKKDAQMKMSLLSSMFKDINPCNILPINAKNDRIGGEYRNLGYYTDLNLKRDETSKRKLQDAIDIFKNRTDFYEKMVDRFEKENNNKCKREAEKNLDEYTKINIDLFDIVTGETEESPRQTRVIDTNKISFQEILERSKEYIANGKRFKLGNINLGKLNLYRSAKLSPSKSKTIRNDDSQETNVEDTENLLFESSENKYYIVQQLSNGRLNIYENEIVGKYDLKQDNFSLIANKANIEPELFTIITAGGKQKKYRKTKKSRKSHRSTRRNISFAK